MFSHSFLRGLLALLLLAGIGIAPAYAAESYDNCGSNFIVSLPAVISTQGTWCMNKDLATAITSGNAITISTNNVTIDCNNFKLGGLAAGFGTFTNGIFATSKTGITIRNCNIRGFSVGAYFATSGSTVVVEDNAFYGNTVNAIAMINVDSSVIRNNRINTTGGSTAQSFAAAIYLDGGNTLVVRDNSISGVAPDASTTSTAWGIYDTGLAAVVRGNDISGVLGSSSSGSAHGFGIELGLYGKALDNTVDNVNGGGAKIGVYCPSSTAFAKNTVASQLISATSGCTDGGGNVKL